MDENLQRLTRELLKETCPRRVRDEVARRIAAQASRSTRFGFAISLTAVALALLCCLAVWRRPMDHRATRPLQVAQQATPGHAQVVAQAEGALSFVGSVLLDAGAHSEKAIFKQAVPPLRNSLETTRNKLTHLINQ